VIGARTLAALGLLALAALGAGGRGLLRAGYLDGLTATACVLIGLFAALAVALLAVGWRPGRRSRWHLGWSRSRRLLELPAPVQVALLAATFTCIGLLAFGNREAAVLAAVPDQLRAMSLTERCGDAAGAPAVTEAAPEPAPAPAARGCALIRRAYELGYADDLGECAPRAAEAEAEAAQAQAAAPCTARQDDEPALHYLWRILDDRAGDVAATDPAGAVARGVRELETRFGYLDTLWAHQKHSVTASPHAAHHLWTNLEAPRAGSWLASLVAGDRCHDWTDLALRVRWPDGERAASALVEHALAQLLFNQRFGNPAGNCPEYTVHWGAPADACARLVASPASFLDRHDALEPIEAVLDRHRRRSELRGLDRELGETVRSAPPPAEAVVSLQCFVVGAGGAGPATATEVSIDRVTLPVRELRAAAIAVTGAGQLEVYQQLATLLAGGRYAGPIAEEASPARALASPPGPAALEGEGFALARLEVLRQADPFLGNGWPLESDELRQVYPFHLHLDHFIDAFRRRYRMQRGRL
jgi:hypothetical protein